MKMQNTWDDAKCSRNLAVWLPMACSCFWRSGRYPAHTAAIMRRVSLVYVGIVGGVALTLTDHNDAAPCTGRLDPNCEKTGDRICIPARRGDR